MEVNTSMCPKLCNEFIYFEFLTFTVLWVHRQIVLEKGVASLLAQRRTSQQRRRQETGLIAELDPEFESHWISLTKMCRIQQTVHQPIYFHPLPVFEARDTG